MSDSFLEKTGKSLDEWVKLLQAQKLEKHGQMIAWLKSEHGMTHGFANTVAHTARKSSSAFFEEDDLLTTQYSKGKEHLRPVYDRILAEVQTFGEDVEVAPKKSSVSLRRKKQFALVQPSTKTRIDLGLKLPGKDLTDRLENSGPFGTMCTHRVRLTDVSEVDAELIAWLREAYDQAG